jgi:hypothetical protein
MRAALQPAAQGEYSSVAEVTIAKAFLCTGTLIAPNYVHTAGHCGSITGGSGVASPAGWPAAAIEIRIGSNKPGQGEKVPVSSVTVEPDYVARQVGVELGHAAVGRHPAELAPVRLTEPEVPVRVDVEAREAGAVRDRVGDDVAGRGADPPGHPWA